MLEKIKKANAKNEVKTLNDKAFNDIKDMITELSTTQGFEIETGDGDDKTSKKKDSGSGYRNILKFLIFRKHIIIFSVLSIMFVLIF